MQGHARHRAPSFHGGEETQAKEVRRVLPESLRQQLTVAKQTLQLAPLGDDTTVVLACGPPGHAALCSTA